MLAARQKGELCFAASELPASEFVSFNRVHISIARLGHLGNMTCCQKTAFHLLFHGTYKKKGMMCGALAAPWLPPDI